MGAGATLLDLELRDPEPFEGIPGLTSRDVEESLLRLLSDGLIDGMESAAFGNSTWSRLRVTARGLIVMGEWPDLDRVATAASLHRLLRALSEDAPEDDQTALRRAAGVVGTNGRRGAARNGCRRCRLPWGGSGWGMTVWERRDLPVLRALATSDDENVRQGFLHLSAAEAKPLGLDLTMEEVYDAVLTLGDADYIEGNLQHESGRSAIITRFQVTGRGQQALGEWPLFDQLASPQTLALLLERLAEEAPTDEEARNLRRAASYMRGLAASTLRSASIAALAYVARAHFGLA